MKRIFSIFTAVVLAFSVLITCTFRETEKAFAADDRVLSFNWNLIESVGRQTPNTSACACFSLAYCRSILDGYAHTWGEYDKNGGTNQNNGYCMWGWGDYSKGHSGSIQGALQAVYNTLNQGRPAILYVTGRGSSQHWVTIIGYKISANYNDLSVYDFLMIDPVVYAASYENLGNAGYSVKGEGESGYAYVTANSGSVPFPNSTKPSKPSVSVNSGDSSNPVKVSWNACENTTHYDIRFYNSGGTLVWAIGACNDGEAFGNRVVYTNTSYSHAFSAGSYYVRVVAVNNDTGEWNYADDVSFTVSPTYPDKPVVNVNVTDSAHPVEISYQNCNYATDYCIRYYDASDNLIYAIGDSDDGKNFGNGSDYTETSHSYTFPAGTYKVVVAAINENDGVWTFSDFVPFTVNEPVTTVRFNIGREFKREIPVSVTIEYPHGYIGSLFVYYPNDYLEPVFDGDSDVLVNPEQGMIEIIIDSAPESTYTKDFKMQTVVDIPDGEYKLTAELKNYYDADNFEHTLDYTTNEGTIRIYHPEKLEDIYGDTNFDRIISVSDISNIIHYSKTVPKDAYSYAASDLNADGMITDEDTEIAYQLTKEQELDHSKWVDLYSKLDTKKLLKHELEILDSGSCGKTDSDQVQWLFFDDGTLMIAGSGEMSDVITSPWNNYKANIKQVVISEDITHIKANAFDGYKELEQVFISETVTSIGEEAFFGCHNLKSITLPNNLNSIGAGAFCDCTGLENIVIPSGITKIEMSTFADCDNLKEVVIPNTVNQIGSFAFSDCSSLEKISIPESVTSIGSLAFRECKSLTDIIFYNPACIIADNEQTVYSEATIHGYSSSTAQEYADKYGNSFVPLIENGFTVSFDANGGKGTMEAQTFEEGTEYILPQCTFTAPGDDMAFYGWQIGDSTYAPGDKVTITEDTVIKAIWHDINPTETGIAGDVSGDGKVDTKDAMLLTRYVNDWEGVTLDLDVADLDSDGKVDTKDAMILTRYVNAWEGYEKYFINKE